MEYASLKDHEDAVDRTSDVIFAVLGFAYLFPFWALVQPVDYWHILFPTFNVEFDISLTYTVASVLTLVWVVFVSGVRGHNVRIVGGLATQVAVLVVLPFVALVPSPVYRHVMVLTSTVWIAIATAILDSSVFGLAALFPKGAIEHVQFGMGISGLVTAIFRVVSKACFPASMLTVATTTYFFAGAVTVGSAIIAYFALLRLPQTQDHLHADRTQHSFQCRLLTKVWKNQALVVLNYATTLAVYPGVVSELRSFQSPMLNSNEWWPLLLLTLYAAMEVVGRYGAAWSHCGFTPQSVWRAVVTRLVLIPALVCAAKGVWLTHDIISVGLVMALALSNGYVGTLTVVLVNDCVDPSERSATGMVSSLCINIGLILGAAVAYFVSQAAHM
ncbi:hypothetical protein H310_02071 [Aphanomyces invadans]|uniref:Major facilitator superfamily (MFS) profile domain-containing protein n=1 Tax=Aphanomyces invadans TaxID=157072 RepID=A0A024UMQ9_9STRA|nr:hypothetical protein H310_02071 [Aphanomyces invadans]ETW07594.1 hypothetical protein H310_02071 [Aphanomyces invadans]|eukprot:XP_008863687.1 hypothetical protein H310_02071 [Aphanomyces invadans]